MTTLDSRLLTAGLTVSTATLVAVFIDHYRGIPAVSACPACGHQFADGDIEGDCPTNSTVRPLLIRRFHENKTAMAQLTANQVDDLKRGRKPVRIRRTVTRQPLPGDLFDPAPYRRNPGGLL